ncbi:hypothetical protein [Photobacterium leiognathi]|uniref:hypothetical protein n=1 Tax=Photobacterium leiognathi TaxID=553611 RepID=UPI002980C70A|nr:hypothetical protein [Photobacterium leiognathi]
MKTKLISSVIASAILTLTGCSSVDSSSVETQDINDLVVIQKGASLQTATTVLANIYGVKKVNWDRKIDRSDFRLQNSVTISKSGSAQKAIDSVYSVIPQLYASVDQNNKQINVTLNDVKYADSTHVGLTGFDSEKVKDNSQIVHVSKHLTVVDNAYSHKSYKTHLKTKVALDSEVKNSNNSSLMTGEESLNKVMPVSHNHFLTVEKGTMLSKSLMNDFLERDYKIVWSVDEKVANLIHQPLKETVKINDTSLDSMVESSSEILSKISKESVQVKLFPHSKQAVVYIGEKDNVSLFNTSEGRLSQNVERLAAQFGWSLNKSYGWLADNDYMINVPFPVVSSNDINSALTKLLVPYNGKITHKLLESNKQVFIVDAK